MSQFTSAKYKACIQVLNEERDVESVKSLRQRCIERFVAECGCTKNGASTYFANLTAAERGVVHKTATKVVKAVKSVMEPKGLEDAQMYSAVTVDVNKIAIDSRTFTDKAECLDYCGDYKHFVVGIQKIGAKVGEVVVYDEEGEEVLA